jgi:hypothetical protein
MAKSSSPPEFFSIGCLAAMFQVGVPRVRDLLAAADVLPAYVENGVPHFDRQACEAIEAGLRGRVTRPAQELSHR